MSVKKIVDAAENIGEVIVEKVNKAADATVRLSDEEKKNLEKQKESCEQDLSSIQGDIDTISNEVFRAYLSKLSSCYHPKEYVEKFKFENRVRAMNITRLVVTKSEDTIDKLKNVYNVLSQADCAVALIFDNKVQSCNVYLVVCNTGKDDDPTKTDTYLENLECALCGNFPGTECRSQRDVDGNPSEICNLAEEVGGIISNPQKTAVAAVTNIASEKSEKFISQSIEKLIDGFMPTTTQEEYTLVLLAQSCNQDKIGELKGKYGSWYTALSPFATWQKNTTYSETASLMKGISGGLGGQLGVPGVASISLNVELQGNKNMAYGSSEALTLTSTLFPVKNTMERIEQQIKRLESCETLGMWEFAAYAISPNYSIATNVANMYRSLAQGDQSFLEPAATNAWGNTKPEDVQKIKDCLARFHHPAFEPNAENENLPITVSIGTYISGTELAHALSLPHHSISGLPVLECAEFGRNILTQKGAGAGDVELGKLYHMRKEGGAPLTINSNSLTAHTFITGSTGAGKSNTIYTLLDRLCLSGKSDTHFLVIEPAKGEYKDTLGGYKGVSVYGTNPKKTQLLRLNPFAFPEDIHVLEHIDRLIEIFNACWPMYAAMPAVLKSAVENAYSNVGWSLNASSNPSGRVPTFRDVMDALPQVIRTKGFSKDTQGDYEGALLTRVESLTNGINGQVLCSCDPVQDEALFDENVIVDLSRVGSMETKALLMGILVLKLQEHRMAQRSAGKNKPNSGLAHVTVLEEAHNLLRRTSSEQSQESANLQGKSVEMLTNAIAELRSFGEGFVIADQSPGLLDMAVIRNTNTKIIMRLPDEGDRQLVGRAAGLNDDQIVELSKLETGVAAIYQNEWLEPVLCKVDRFGDEKVKPFDYKKQPPDAGSFYPTMFSLLCGQTDYCELTKEQVDAFYRWVERISIREELKETLCTAIENKKQVPNPDATLYVLVSGDTLFKATSNETPTDTIAQRLMERYQMDNLELVRLMSEHLVDMQIRLGRMEQTASSIEKMPGERWR